MTRWDTLLAVQEHDTHIDQLDPPSETLPARATLAGIEGEVAKVDRRDRRGRRRLNDLGRSQQRLEDEIASIAQQAAQADKQLYAGTTNNPRELQAMQDDIESIKRRIAKLEDQELEVMEAIEPVDAERAAAGGPARPSGRQAQALRAEIAEDEVAIDGRAGGRPGRARDRRRGGPRGPDGPSTTGCGRARGASPSPAWWARRARGCHLGLSAVEVDRIRKLSPEEPVHCEECGRLLVRE